MRKLFIILSALIFSSPAFADDLKCPAELKGLGTLGHIENSEIDGHKYDTVDGKVMRDGKEIDARCLQTDKGAGKHTNVSMKNSTINSGKGGRIVKLPPLEVRTVAGEQILLITPDGKFMAHGKYIATDKEAVAIMIRMLHEQSCKNQKGK